MRRLCRAQIITIARFRKPANPRKCRIHAFHVWVWDAPDDSSLSNEELIHLGPPVGQTCQCGCLPWTAEDKQAGWKKNAEAQL